MTVAVNDSVVVVVPNVGVALKRTVSGVEGCTKTDVNPVPTAPLLSVAVRTTLKVPPVW